MECAEQQGKILFSCVFLMIFLINARQTKIYVVVFWTISLIQSNLSDYLSGLFPRSSTVAGCPALLFNISSGLCTNFGAFLY